MPDPKAEPAKGPGAKEDVLPSCFTNSFDPLTLVLTNTGLFPIGKLTLGTPVLAYNELTSQNGYYPITHIFTNTDPTITSLTLTDSATGQRETITTTPEHPFYVQQQADSAARPKPVGHAELNTHWVGAGHLRVVSGER